MKTIAILGARGRLGRTVAKAFLDAGYSVRAVTRDGRLPGELDGAIPAAADARDRDALVKATEGADFIFNGLNPPYTEWAQNCMPMAESVVAACRANGAVHLFPGNVYNFGAPLPAELTEGLASNPTTRKGRIRVEMENLFERAARTDGVKTVILRAGDFFGGSGAGSWFDLVVVNKMSKGVYTSPGPSHLVHEWAYLPDLAAAFVALAGAHDRLGPFETLHFPGHAVTSEQMKAAASKALGKPLKMSGLPWWLLRLAGTVNPMMREIAEMAYLHHQPHRLVSGRLAGIVGDLPHTPLEQAVASALADLGHIRNAAARAA